MRAAWELHQWRWIDHGAESLLPVFTFLPCCLVSDKVFQRLHWSVRILPP
jgi:hypothetical protein